MSNATGTRRCCRSACLNSASISTSALLRWSATTHRRAPLSSRAMCAEKHRYHKLSCTAGLNCVALLPCHHLRAAAPHNRKQSICNQTFTLDCCQYRSGIYCSSKTLLQYYSVLQSTSPVLLHTTKYYSVLQSTPPLQQFFFIQHRMFVLRLTPCSPQQHTWGRRQLHNKSISCNIAARNGIRTTSTQPATAYAHEKRSPQRHTCHYTTIEPELDLPPPLSPPFWPPFSPPFWPPLSPPFGKTSTMPAALCRSFISWSTNSGS